MRLTTTATMLALGITMALAPAAPALAQVAGSTVIKDGKDSLGVVALGYRASKLIHSPVYNLQNKRIGEVVDMVVTPHAFVSYMILSVGGFLGIDRKDIAVPIDHFSIVNHKVVLPGGTAKELNELPRFKFSNL